MLIKRQILPLCSRCLPNDDSLLSGKCGVLLVDTHYIEDHWYTERGFLVLN